MESRLKQILITLQNSKKEEIPAYDESAIVKIKEQLLQLTQAIRQLTESNKTAKGEEAVFGKAKLSVLLDQIYRYKRFLLIYSKWRADRIEDQFWSYGGDLHHSEKPNISLDQKQYFNKYKNLVAEYGEENEIEITVDLEPPLQNKVHIRILQDREDIIDDMGRVIKLTKNATGFYPRRLVERLVCQGYAQIQR